MGINKPISLDGQTVNVDLTSVNDKLDTILAGSGKKTYKQLAIRKTGLGSTGGLTTYKSLETINFDKPFIITSITASSTSGALLGFKVDGTLITMENYESTLETSSRAYLPYASTESTKVGLHPVRVGDGAGCNLMTPVNSTLEILYGSSTSNLTISILIRGYEE